LKSIFLKRIDFSFVAVFLTYFLLAVLRFHPVLFGGMTFAKRDIARYFYPMWKYAVQNMRAGVIPFWNPHTMFGAPFFANVQTCIFYPFSTLLYFGDYTRAFNLYIIFHLTLASMAAYVWMRDCGASRRAAWLAGMILGMSGYTVSAINLTICLCTLSYFPLVLVAFRRSLNSKTFAWKGLTALLLFCQYLAGDPAIVYATIGVLLLAAIFKTAKDFSVSEKLKIHYLGVWLVVLGLFLCVSAFQSFSFLELIVHSHRSHMSFLDASEYSLPFKGLARIFIPPQIAEGLEGVNRWVENIYLGFSVTVLAIFAAVSKERGWKIYTGLFFLSVAISLGANFVLYRLCFYCVPFFNIVRYPQRFFFLSSFAASCLAGLGADRLWRREKKEGCRRKCYLIFLALTALIFLDLHANDLRQPMLPSATLTDASPNVRTLMRDVTKFRVMGSIRILDESFRPPARSLEEKIKNYQDWMYPNCLLPFGIDDALGYDAIFLKNTSDIFIYFVLTDTLTEQKMLDLMNVKYLSRAAQTLYDKTELLQTSGDSHLFRNKMVLPRAYLVPGADIKRRNEILDYFSSEAFDPRKTVILEESPGIQEGETISLAAEPSEEVLFDDYSPNTVKMNVRVADKPWLFFSDTYYPGWTAWVDGQKTKIYRANYAFRALHLERGDHQIIWKFEPTYFKLGCLISFLTLFSLAFYCTVFSRRYFTQTSSG